MIEIFVVAISPLSENIKLLFKLGKMAFGEEKSDEENISLFIIEADKNSKILFIWNEFDNFLGNDVMENEIDKDTKYLL